MSAQYDQLFQEVGKEYGVDPMILKGIASVESNFNPKAVGPKTKYGSAQGMMQFIPAMQKPYGITDPFDPEQSVTGAARMMKDLLKRYKGDVGKALEAYNGGPRLVGKSTQTRKYAEKVQRKAQLFAKNTQKPSIEVAGTATQGPSALQRTSQASQETPKFNLGPKTVAQGPSLEGMGEDYKAALALSYLTEDDSDGLTVTERAEQMLADQEEADSIRGDALSQIFTMPGEEEGEVNPFSVYAAVQNPKPPAQFADGGFVLGGTSLPGMPNPMLDPVRYLTPEVKQIMESIEPLNKKYEEEAAAYNRGVEEYNKAYNAWLEKANAYNDAVAGLEKQQEAFNKYADVYNTMVAPTYAKFGWDAPDFNTWASEVASGKRQPLEYDVYDEAGNYVTSRLAGNQNALTQLGANLKSNMAYERNPMAFPGSEEQMLASLPTKPAEWKGTFTGVEPKLGYDPKQYEEKLAPLRAAQERANTVGKQQQLALEVVANPEAYNLAGFGMAEGGPVVKMATGGVTPLPTYRPRVTTPVYDYTISEVNPFGFGKQTNALTSKGITQLWSNKKTGEQVWLSGGNWVPPKGQENDWTNSLSGLPENWNEIKKTPVNDYVVKGREDTGYAEGDPRGNRGFWEINPITGDPLYTGPNPAEATWTPETGVVPINQPAPTTPAPAPATPAPTGNAPVITPQRITVGGANVTGQQPAPVVPQMPTQIAPIIVPTYQVDQPQFPPAAMQNGGEVSAMDRVREFLEGTDWRGVGKNVLDIMVNPPTNLLAALKGTGWPSALALGLVPEDLNANEDELLARYRAIAERERTTPQPPMAGRSKGSPPYGEDVDMQMFGDTGDRSMAEAKKGFGRSVDAIRRGVQYSPADLLGAPVDVINMALEPFGLGSEKPFLGSEYLIDKGVQAGIYEKPTGEGEETLARFAAGMINPTLGPRAVGKLAEGIETLGRTPPKGAVTLQDAAADRQLHENPLTRSAEKPFIGELESLLMGLGKEKVTPAEVTQLVSQYKASLGSKMERRKRRVLEERIDEIFMGKDPNTPISMEQLFSDLERTSPKRLSQEILGPEYFQTNPDSVIELHEKVDNPYTTKPLGVTTITFDTPKNANDLSGRLYDMEKAAYSLRDVFVGIGGEGQMNKLFGLQRYLTDLENVAPSSPEVAKLRAAIEDASEELPKLGKAAKHLHTALQARPTSAELDAVQYGIMKDYPDLFNLANRRAIYGEDGGEDLLYQLKVGRATHAKMVKGLLDFEKELIDQGKMTDRLRDEIELAKFKFGKSGNSSVGEFDNAAFDPYADKVFQSLRAQGVYDVARRFGTGIGDEPTRAVINAADDVVATLQKSLPFGMDLNDSVHVMNTKGRNVQQLGFTRFVEFDPGETITNSNLKAYDFPASKKGALFATELQSDMRAADREIEQPFNLKNQEALRDLLIKNLVDTAVKRGRDLVLMPGADSKQAQLYEFIDRYVEATVKDLGPNFRAVKVPTVNSSGQYVIRPGIYITPKGEKEILEKGLKFAKGGMVDKPLYDRAA